MVVYDLLHRFVFDRDWEIALKYLGWKLSFLFVFKMKTTFGIYAKAMLPLTTLRKDSKMITRHLLRDLNGFEIPTALLIQASEQTSFVSFQFSFLPLPFLVRVSAKILSPSAIG